MNDNTWTVILYDGEQRAEVPGHWLPVPPIGATIRLRSVNIRGVVEKVEFEYSDRIIYVMVKSNG